MPEYQNAIGRNVNANTVVNYLKSNNPKLKGGAVFIAARLVVLLRKVVRIVVFGMEVAVIIVGLIGTVNETRHTSETGGIARYATEKENQLNVNLAYITLSHIVYLAGIILLQTIYLI